MAITLATPGRNGAADGVLNQLNGGNIVWATGAEATLAQTTLDATDAFPAASAGASSMTGAPRTSAAATAAGTIALALFRTSGNAEVFRCTVGTSGQDINLTSVVIAIGETVRLDSFTYTQPAS